MIRWILDHDGKWHSATTEDRCACGATPPVCMTASQKTNEQFAAIRAAGRPSCLLCKKCIEVLDGNS